MKIFDQTTLHDQPNEAAHMLATDGAQLIDARSFAALLAISVATFNRMKAANKLPRPIELSAGCHRWKFSEVRSWIDAGCPGRKEWEARRR